MASRGSEAQPTHAYVQLPPSSRQSTTDSRHNAYSDLKNEWHPNARRHTSLSVTSLLFVGLVALSILGFGVVTAYKWWLARQMEAYASLSQPPDKTIIVGDRCSRPDEFIDFAATENGGKIVAAETSPPYHGSLMESVLRINKPEEMLSSENAPEHCWAFQGSKGFATVQLGAQVYPKGFTLVHVNSIKSQTAPKDFSVYNVSPSLDQTLLLGSYAFEFEIHSERRASEQMFSCSDLVKYTPLSCAHRMTHVRVEFTSNYGSKDATCVYQLRVHGDRVPS